MSVSMRCSIEPTPTEAARSIRTNYSRCSRRKPHPDAVVPVVGRAADQVDPAVAVVRAAKVAVMLREAREVVAREVAPAEAGRVGQMVAVPVDLHNQDRSCLPSCKTNCD